jgi:hypothetical protein
MSNVGGRRDNDVILNNFTQCMDFIFNFFENTII